MLERVFFPAQAELRLDVRGEPGGIPALDAEGRPVLGQLHAVVAGGDFAEAVPALAHLEEGGLGGLVKSIQMRIIMVVQDKWLVEHVVLQEQLQVGVATKCKESKLEYMIQMVI